MNNQHMENGGLYYPPQQQQQPQQPAYNGDPYSNYNTNNYPQQQQQQQQQQKYDVNYQDYYDDQQEEEEEEIAAERELAEDAQWKLIQKNTFTRWANEHLKLVNSNVIALDEDFSDGLKLVSLLEVLSGKKFHKYNKKPNFRTQKFENVTMCLKYLEVDEGIKIVNIDSSDIVDSKLKLILGLIWTLILHYSICMPTWDDEDAAAPKTKTPKQRLLAWIQNKIPEKNIQNFTGDWNDGTAITALVDALAPGLCPDWQDLNPENAVPNAKQAMDAAEKWMDVPQLIHPSEMCNPMVDDMSMMTYLSQYPNAKLKHGAPLKAKINPARIKSYGPGVELYGNVQNHPARFIVETQAAGDGEPEIIVVNPAGAQEPCEKIFNNDRSVSFNCVYVPTMAGPYRVHVKFAGKETPKSPFLVNVEAIPGDAGRCTASGPGVEKTGVMANRKTYFDVHTKNAGVGVVDIGIIDPSGRCDIIKPIVARKSDELWYVEYTPLIEGLHSVNVSFAGTAIPASPYPVHVSRDGHNTVDPNRIPPGKVCAPLDNARSSIASPTAKPSGCPAPPPPVVEPVARQQSHVQMPLMRAPSVDPRKCYATGRGIQPKGVRIGDEADFKVHTQGAGDGDMAVKVLGPGGVEERVRVRKLDPVTYDCTYSPHKPGPHAVVVNYGGQSIPKSPFKVDVGPMKQSRIVAFGPGLETGMVGYPACFTVETNGETGALGFSIEGPSQAKIDCKDNGDGSADVSYWPTAPGEYAVHILCDEEDIPKSPYMVDVRPMGADFDPTKVEAYGPGLEKAGNTVNKWAEFTVDARRAGRAPLKVFAMDVDYYPVDVLVQPNEDGTHLCRYQPTRAVKHTILISYGGLSVPKSPFRVYVEESSNPSKVRVYGPALDRPIKTFQPSFLIVDCSQAGPGDVAIALADEKGMDTPVKTTDNGDNTFRIDFTPATVGLYTANVFFADQEIPSSPYKIKVEPSIDVSKVRVEGLEERVFLDSTTDFTVDAKQVIPKGHGKVKAFVTSPSGVKTEALTNSNNDGTYKCFYTPVEPGMHTVEVTYESFKVPRSPFKVNVVPGCDPSRVRAYGPGLEGGHTNQSQTFVVETRGAGQGGLGLSIEGPSEAKMNCRDNRDGSCTVEYLPTKQGDYDINIKFAEREIPGSPFHVHITDEVNPGKVRCYGPGIEAIGVRKGQPALFTVDASQAGVAPLDVATTDAKGRKRPAQSKNRGDGTYDVVYYPDLEGPLKVDVNYAGKPVPGSPFNTRILPSFEAGKVLVSGEGVRPTGVLATLPTNFHIDTREAGLADLDVSITDPFGQTVASKIQDNGDGTYLTSYTPQEVGMYVAAVKFGGNHVPHSPFNVHTSPAGDASKCRILDGVRTTIPVGEECVININTAEAGYGNITCHIRSTSGSDVDIDIVDNEDGTVSVLYTPRVPGAYPINLKFGGQPIPNGQFTQQATEKPIYVADEYHSVGVNLPVGPVFAFVDAVVTTPSGQHERPVLEDNKDGSVKIRYAPLETGLHRLDVAYNHQPIQGAPFFFYVHPTNRGVVTAHGQGLIFGISGQPCPFTIVTKDAGTGGLALAVEGPSKAEISCSDNKDGTCSVSYLPTVPGDYSIIIKFADQHIPGSPFTSKVISPYAEDEHQKKAYISVGTSSEVSLKVSEADISSLTANIRSPSGYEEPCLLKKLPNGHLGISFTPREVGDYLVNVYRHGNHIPNSPFKIFVGESEVGRADRVRVYGRGLIQGRSNQLNEFFVNTKDAGYGGLSLSVEGPSKADIDCHDNEDGSCRVTYRPTEPGDYLVNIKFADEHVPGSPFMVRIDGDPSGRVMERILRQKEAADVTHIGSECELSLKIPGTNRYDMQASVCSPSGVTEQCHIDDLGEGHYSIKFVPNEMGIHTVNVRHRAMHIPGSPFQFTVGPITDGGAHKVRAIGPGLHRAELLKPNHFSIYTREAGAGGLSIAVEGPSKAEIEFDDRKDGSCDVSYRCQEAGEYLVSIKFNDQHIPDSPFRVHVTGGSQSDARRLFIRDMQEHGWQINKPAAFTVDFNGAQGRLDARVIAPSGAEDQAIIQEIEKDRYAVRFTPRENGAHMIEVRLNGVAIQGSPFRVVVGRSDADPSLVRAYGEGLVHGYTGKLSKFRVNTVNGGSGALAVTIDGPSKVQLSCREVEDGYEFWYTPTAPGEYTISIKYGGNHHIPGSPFKAHVDGPGGPAAWSEQSQVVVETTTKTHNTQKFSSEASLPSDHTKVKVDGTGLRRAYANKETTFNVDTTDAGYNMLMVGVLGPDIPCEEVKVKHVGDCLYNVNYTVHDPGNYVLVVKWGDQHIPGSPFHISVV